MPTESNRFLHPCLPPVGAVASALECNNRLVGAGPVCGICKPGHAMTTLGCSAELCPQNKELAFSRFRATLLVIVAFSSLWVSSWYPIIVHALDPCCSGALSRMQSRFSTLHVFLDRHKVAQYVKAYISGLQVVGSFAAIHSNWPEAVHRFLMWMQVIFQLDI